MRLGFCKMAVLALASAAWMRAAQLTIIVTDASGLPVPHASIWVAGSSKSQRNQTDEQGRFVFPDLPAKRSRIHIGHEGFAPFEQLWNGNEKVLRAQLTIEPRHESLVVTAKPEALPTTGIGSVSLSDVQLRNISNNASVWVDYAELLAGVANVAAQIYVDGMPAVQLPPASLIARIIVNPDPFSAEYADGGSTHIDILTKAPERRLHFNFGADAVGAGAKNVLAPGPGAVSHSWNASFSGPVPRLPVAFSLVTSFSESVDPVVVTAVLPTTGSSNLDSARTGTFGSRSWSLSPNLDYFAAEKLRLHFFDTESVSSGHNLGVGGLTLLDAGMDSAFTNRETRVTFNGGSRIFFRGGFALTRSEASNRARNTSPGLDVIGDFSTGGPAILTSDSTHTAWTLKGVAESPDARWSAGITAAEIGESRQDSPNPGGVYTFTGLDAYSSFLSGSATATWTGLAGDGKLHFRRYHVAPFLQRQLWRSAHITVNAGLRADSQSTVATLVSPRLSAALEWRGFVLRAGAGMFEQDIPASVFIRAIEGDGNHLTPVLIEGAGTNAASQAAIDAAPLVRTSLAPSLALPRQLIEKISLSRSLGRWTPGIEYTETRGSKLLGAERFADSTGWMDVIASDRTRHASQIETHLGYAWKTERITIFHEWVDSHDNTDGPFSYSQQQGNLAAEWARSAGRAKENVTVAGSFTLPHAIYLTVTESWRGSAPYNITVAGDPEGEGLFNDRGGRARNSGNGPAFNSLSAYLTYHMAFPPEIRRMARGVTIGLRADNLLNNKNWLSVGSVAGTPSFGQPMAAAPGRSVRLWFTFD